MINEILAALSAMTGISIGQLGTDNSTAMEVAPSSGGECDFSGATDDTLSLLLLSKHKNQSICIAALDGVINRLTRTRNLPSGVNWNVYAAEVATQPIPIWRNRKSAAGDQLQQ